VDAERPQRTSVDPPAPGESPPLLIATGRSDVRHAPRSFRERLVGILTERCPVCLDGPLFRSPWHLHDKCPACGHHQPVSRDFRHTLLVTLCGLLTVGFTALLVAASVWALMTVVPRQVGIDAVILFALGVDALFVPRIYRHMRTACEHAWVPTEQ